MNKKLMAVAVAGALAAPALALAQSANVSIYGNFDGSLRSAKYSSSSVNATAAAGGTVGQPIASSLTKQQLHFNAPRWGIRGTEDLGGGLTAFFQMESGMNPDGRAVTSDGVTAGLGGRDSYLGLRSASWGSFAVGGFSTAYTNVAGVWNAVESMGHAQQIMGNTDTTGTAPNPNCNSAVVGATGTTGSPVTTPPPTNASGSTTTAGCTQAIEGNSLSFHRRTANYLEYTTPAMSGFTGKIGTALGENKESGSQTSLVQAVAGNAGATAYNPKHWSYALLWAGGPFSAGIGYETHEGFRATNVLSGAIRNAKDSGLTIGGKWNFGAGEIGMGWERLKYGNTALNAVGGGFTALGSNNFQQTNWVINGKYKVTAAGTISAGYSKTPGRKNCGNALADTNGATDVGTCGTPTGASMFGLSYDHALSKRTGLYAAYGKINNNGNTVAGATYYYIQGPLSNGAGGTIGGLAGGTDVTSYMMGMKHSF